MNYSSPTPQNKLVTGSKFFDYFISTTFSAFWEILTSDWLDDVIQSTAPYVTIKCEER